MRGNDAEALGGVVQAEANDQWQSQGELPAGCRLADGQALGEVVQTDTHGNQQREPAGSGPVGQPVVASSLDLADTHRSRAVTTRACPGRPHVQELTRHPALVIHKRQQADGEPSTEEQAVSRGRSQPAFAFVGRGQGVIDGSPGNGEHVPEEKQQHADGCRVQQCAQRWC